MLTVLSNQQIVVIHTLQFFQCFATTLTSGITEDTADNQIEKSIASHVRALVRVLLCYGALEIVSVIIIIIINGQRQYSPSQYPVMYIEILVLRPSLLVWFIQLRVL